jgi:hypothetical protein
MAKCDFRLLKADNFDLENKINEAKHSVAALTDKTCELARELKQGPKNRETRQKRWDRSKKVLLWASMTLGSGMMGNVVDSPVMENLIQPVRQEICIRVPQAVHYCADEGLKQVEKNALEERQEEAAARRQQEAAARSALDDPTRTNSGHAESQGTKTATSKH